MQVSLLGRVEVWGHIQGERQLGRLGGLRQRALLARLAIDVGSVVSRRELFEFVWDGEPPSSGDTALRVHVTRLRKALEPIRGDAAGVIGRDGGYCLDLPADHVDLHRFRAEVVAGAACERNGDPSAALDCYDQGLAQWSGRPLADLDELDFAARIARQLQEERLSAIERRADLALELGRHDEVVVSHEPLVADEPLRERFTEQLAVALYRSGRQADALRVIGELRTLLRRQLGLLPGPGVQLLEQAVLQQDPRLLRGPLPRIS
ncbi:MAG: AfsR/SARP family transcriptional regulator [Acidimicrobiales bacterium]|nr:AfsR/SARP family transcriptional regulator [Acidimicrobiales bacterium]